MERWREREREKKRERERERVREREREKLLDEYVHHAHAITGSSATNRFSEERAHP
jgi:hypothetical protein